MQKNHTENFKAQVIKHPFFIHQQKEGESKKKHHPPNETTILNVGLAQVNEHKI